MLKSRVLLKHTFALAKVCFEFTFLTTTRYAGVNKKAMPTLRKKGPLLLERSWFRRPLQTKGGPSMDESPYLLQHDHLQRRKGRVRLFFSP